MPILMRKISNEKVSEMTDIARTQDVLQENFDQNIQSSNEYNDILISSLQATYEGCKCNSPEIVQEGFSDVVESIIEWFKKWLVKFKEFITTAFKRMYLYLSASTKKIEIFTSKGGKMEDFTVQGYVYTIDSKPVNTGCVYSIISKTESAIAEVANSDSNLRVIANKVIADIASPEAMNEYRGEICGRGATTAEDFIPAIRSKFRGGMEERKDIVVTSKTIREFAKKAIDMKKVLAVVKKEKDDLEAQVKRIIDHTKHQSTIVHRFRETSSIEKQQDIVRQIRKRTDSPDIDRYRENADEDVYRAITMIYNQSNNAIRSVHIMCDRYLNEKIKAIQEALAFYNWCIDKANGSRVETSTEAFEYTEDFEQFFYIANEQYNNDLLNEGINELVVLGQCYEAQEIMFEAGGVEIKDKEKPVKRHVKGIFGNIKEFIRRIVNFLTETISKFSDAVADILKTDQEWLGENNSYFEDIPSNILMNMSLTVVPYFQRKTVARMKQPKLPMSQGGTIQSIIDWIVDKLKGRKKEGNIYIREQDFYAHFFPDLYKYDKESPKRGAMRYYRDGEPETITLKGGECKNAIIGMRDFCRDYKMYSDSAKRTITEVKNMIADQESALKRLETERSRINSSPLKEMLEVIPAMGTFSILEGSFLYNTEFFNMKKLDCTGDDYESLIEGIAANVDNSANKVTGNTAAAPSQSGNKSVKDANSEKKDEAPKPMTRDEKAQATARNDIEANEARQILKAYQVCVTIATCKLTVCEEIHKSYMKILHGIVDGLKGHSDQVKKNEENREYNEEQKEEAERKHKERLDKMDKANEVKKKGTRGVLPNLKRIIVG